MARSLMPAGALLLAASLSGCDVLLLSPTLPGLVPGIGQPIHGQVVDANTGQPIGHATVVGDLGKGDVGWATTDNGGNFTLYGSISRRVISISRAGYTSVTYANGGLTDGRVYQLSPLFPDSGNFHHTEATINGSVDVVSNGQLQPATALGAGAVFLGSKNTAINNGAFGFGAIEADLPGNVYSGILAGGKLADGGDPNGAFSFAQDPNGTTMDFDYQVVSIPFPDASSSTYVWPDKNPLVMGKNFAGTANVSYSNINWLSGGGQVETDISLDFGLLGSVQVARSFASQTTVPIPSFANYPKYILEGTAFSADRTKSSTVMLATNTPSLANFWMLSPPQPISPAPGSKGVGAHPVFSWAPVASADSYVVKVIEQDNPLPKWQAVVDGSTTAIGYPWFLDGDVNGGALLPGASYSWEVHAVSSSFEGTSPQSLEPGDVLPASILPATGPVDVVSDSTLEALGLKDGPIFSPYRKRTLESVTKGMEFTR